MKQFFPLLVLYILLGCTDPVHNPDIIDGGEDDAPAWPKLYITYNGLEIEQAGIAAIESVYPGTDRQVSIRVENSGFGNLLLAGTPGVFISATDPSLFTLVTIPESPIKPNEFTEFTIRISPVSVGYISGTVMIETNDLDRNPCIFTLAATVDAAPAAVPATGQSTTFAAGDDGDIEAGVPWPAERFTDNAEGTVTIDNLTGLMWASAAGSTTTTWDGALWAANNSTLAGFDDWRLPNVNELMSLINLEEQNPNSWLNRHDEFSGIQSGRYWTSTTIFISPTIWAWVVHMDTGLLARTNVSAIPFAYPWKVRDTGNGVAEVPRTGKTGLYRAGDDGDLRSGIIWPSPRYIPNGDGIILDLLTGLSWTQSPSAIKLDWEDALLHASSLTTGGFDDWRIPNRSEMRSLTSYNYTNWHVYLSDYFGAGLPQGEYWTSSTYAPATSNAWVIVLESGHAVYTAKTDSRLVLAVRGGKK